MGNLLHLEGGPRIMPRYFPGMGVRGFLLTSALLNISLVFFRKNQNPKDMVCTKKKIPTIKIPFKSVYNSFTESLNYLNLSLYTFSGRHSMQSMINKSKS